MDQEHIVQKCQNLTEQKKFRCVIHAYLIKLKALKLQEHSIDFKQHDYKLKSHNAQLEIRIQS